MARTVDTSSTLEDFRQSYNGLAEEIGGLSDLRTSNKTSVVNANRGITPIKNQNKRNKCNSYIISC